MGWLGTLSGWFSGRMPGGDSNWSPSWRAAFGGHSGQQSKSGEIVNQATAGALPAVHRAVTFIADGLASIDLRIVQVQEDGGRVPVAESDVARALAEWSYADKELFIYHAALGGNGFAALRRNARGGVQAIESILPRRVLAKKDESGDLFFIICPDPTYDGIVYADAKGSDYDVVPAQDMLHLKYRNVGTRLGSTLFGEPPISIAAEQLGLVLAARSFQAAIWRKGAVPIGVLSTSGMLKAPVIDRIRQQWEQFYAGGDPTGKTAILEQGLEWKPVKPGVSPADTDLTAYNIFSVREIARLYGVPPSVLAETGSASYSTATEEFRASVVHCLRPWSVRFTDVLDRMLLTRQQRAQGMRIEAPLDHLLVSPGKEMSEFLRELVSAGIWTTNEARNSMGLPDIDGGDVLRIPANSASLGNLDKLGMKQTAQEQPQ